MTRKKNATSVKLIPGKGIIQLVIEAIMNWKVQVKTGENILTGQVIAIDNKHEGTHYMFGTVRVYLTERGPEGELLHEDIPVYITIDGDMSVREGYVPPTKRKK